MDYLIIFYAICRKTDAPIIIDWKPVAIAFDISYDFAKAPFTFKTNLQAAFVYRKNLATLAPIQNLTKYNRKITVDRVQLGLKILEKNTRQSEY